MAKGSYTIIATLFCVAFMCTHVFPSRIPSLAIEEFSVELDYESENVNPVQNDAKEEEAVNLDEFLGGFGIRDTDFFPSKTVNEASDEHFEPKVEETTTKPDPETTLEPEDPETTPATEDPETTLEPEDPETTPATGDPETTPATGDPETTPATGDPSDGTTENPIDSTTKDPTDSTTVDPTTTTEAPGTPIGQPCKDANECINWATCENDKCRCMPGTIAADSGMSCRRTIGQVCEKSADCIYNAICTDTENKKMCACNAQADFQMTANNTRCGIKVDGKCTPGSREAQCIDNAECHLEPSSPNYFCKCLSGFTLKEDGMCSGGAQLFSSFFISIIALAAIKLFNQLQK